MSLCILRHAISKLYNVKHLPYQRVDKQLVMIRLGWCFVAVVFRVEVFWVVMSCSAVLGYQCFRRSKVTRNADILQEHYTALYLRRPRLEMIKLYFPLECNIKIVMTQNNYEVLVNCLFIPRNTFWITLSIWSRGNSVQGLGYGLDDEISIPKTAIMGLFLRHRVQICSEGHPASYPKSYRG
jgi:hypothetical protein